MNKTKMLEAILNDIANVKMVKGAKEEIAMILKNHLGSKRELHPPIEEDGITKYWCRWHQTYYPLEDMVVSKGKSKGYCKAAYSEWSKRNREIKKLEGKIVEAINKDSMDEVKKINENIQELKNKLNDPSTYNPEEDWKNYKSK